MKPVVQAERSRIRATVLVAKRCFTRLDAVLLLFDEGLGESSNGTGSSTNLGVVNRTLQDCLGDRNDTYSAMQE